MQKFLIVLFLVLANSAVLAQDSFSSVEERMTGKEFMATGLSKLTDEELDALNNWLRGHSVATLENRVAGRSSSSGGTQTNVATGGDSRGFEGQNTDKNTIVSRLIGEFDGWDGDTVFELENGMVWKQEESDNLTTKKMTNPVITIKSGLFGSWRLSVENYNKKIEVVRIQ